VLRRRDVLGSASALTLPLTAQPSQTTTPRTLRVAFDFAETGFDPPRVSDQSSGLVIAHIFEAPLSYDPLANPPRLVPQTAVALPEVSADARHFVFTIRPGIFFADDPAFGGKPRELVAEDYVYSVKRYYDPALKSEHLHVFETPRILGLSELRAVALKSKTPFNYDTPVAGLRALDRYRFEVRVAEPSPRLPYVFAQAGWAGAVAREVVQAYVADPMAHPVGTGPYVLKQWRRASRIVLERNPRFRELRYAAIPPPDDAELVAVAAQLQGQLLPRVQRIEISIIEESQPRWLAFLGGELDVLTVPSDFASMAAPKGQLAPFLARRGVRMRRTLAPSTVHSFFNTDDAMVGGYGAAQVALRRAIAIAYDNAEENTYVHGGQHQLAQTMVPPGCWGHEASWQSELGRGDVGRARALLDLYGYLDRDNDGWRERPDGTPLQLRRAFLPDQRSRRQAELWQKRMAAIGLRMQIEIAPFGELIRRALAGQLMMWGFGWTAGSPDADFFLGLAYGPNADQNNDARFKLPAFDRLYERQRVLRDGPERLALVQQALKLMLAYVPYIPHLHTVNIDLVQPHVTGFVRHPFMSERWRSVGLG
jgi:ABC-type transport system substrate-binding protein